MHQPWPEIVEWYEEVLRKNPDWLAGEAILNLARYIRDMPRSGGFYGSTSMHDLCVSQSEPSHPMTSGYLRISPLKSGLIEFRLHDSAIAEKQWHREVSPDDVIGRFEKLRTQLNWGPTSAEPR